MDKLKFDNYLQIEIVKMLLNSQTALTSDLISKTLKSSPQLIRTEIKNINRLLAPFNFEIYSPAGFGYFLNFQSEAQRAFLARSISEEFTFDKQITLEKYQREQLIIRYLVLTDKVVSAQKIIDTFFISRTTLFRDLKRASETIEHAYDLQLVITPYKGIQIQGTELNKRMILARESAFYKEYSLLEQICKKLFLTPIDAKKLATFIKTELNFFVSNNELYSLFIHLYIMLYRISTNHLLSDDSLVTTNQVTKQEQLALQHFFRQYFLELPLPPENELIYFILLIKGFGRKQNSLVNAPLSLKTNVTTIIKSITKETKLPLSQVLHCEDFYQEIQALLIRTQNGFISSNLHIRAIKKHSPFFLELALTIIKKLADYYPLTATELDVCSLAFCLYNIIGIDALSQQRKVLVISSFSNAYSQRLLKQLQNHFPMIIFSYSDIQSVNTESDNSYLFIITDTYLDYTFFKTKIVKINHFLSPQDLNQIAEIYQKETFSLIEKELAAAEKLKLTSMSAFFNYLTTTQKTTNQQDNSSLLEHEQVISYQLRNNVVVIVSFIENSFSTAILKLEQPIYWRYDKVSYILLLNIHDLRLLTLSEWEFLYQQKSYELIK